MSEIIPELQELYELLKASKVGEHITKIDQENRPEVLNVRTTWGSKSTDRMVYITLHDGAPHKFDYFTFSNEQTDNPEEYFVISEGIDVWIDAVLSMAYRILIPSDTAFPAI